MPLNKHCVISVQIRSFFWSIFYCIWAEYRKIRTRKNSVFGHFSRSGNYRFFYDGEFKNDLKDIPWDNILSQDNISASLALEFW